MALQDFKQDVDREIAKAEQWLKILKQVSGILTDTPKQAPKKHTMSPESRERIRAAMIKRWAKKKKQ